MRRNSIIISCMVFVFIVICLLIVDLHRMSEKEVLSQFQEHQFIHARYLADQIKSYFESRLSGVQALSSFPSLQNDEPMERRTDIEAYLHQLKKVHVKAISVLEERGIVVESTDPKSQGLDFGFRDFFLWAKKKENQGKVFVSPFPLGPPSHYFEVLLATPIYQDSSDVKHSKPSRKFVGALLLTIDFEEFLSKQLDFVDPKMNLHQVWIIDKDGTLLYQPKHKEMVLRNIYQRDKNCTQCHTSFDYAEKILKERQGKVGYEMKNSPSKLAAFAPVDFENAPWIVVVSSAYNEVMAFERKSLQGHLMLLGIIVCVLIAGFILLNRNYQQKLKAEEEARHWREKRVLEDKIQQSEVRYRTIVETAHDIIWTLDAQGNFTSMNRTGEEISGYKFSELYGKSFIPLVHPEDLPTSEDAFHRTLQGEPQGLEVRIYAKDGHMFILSVSTVPLYENGKIVGVVGFGRDITEHKQAEEALRESETKYRIVADNTFDWEWWRDPEGNFIYVSSSCKKVTHHEAEEFIRDSDLLLRIMHPDDKPSFIRHQVEVEQTHSPGEIEFRILRPDGSLRWIAHGCQPVFDEQGHFLGRRGSNRDVTEHKWAEEALRESEKQLRHLSSQLLTAQEKERSRISRELHDELGGALAVLKLRCSLIEKNLQKDETGVREECKQNVQYIDEIIENVGRLSRDLSPSILEDLGLSAALRRLIDNFVKNYNIKVASDTVDVDHLFRKDAQIMIYRIFQEALTNIGKHAQAKNVSMKVKKDEDRISFLVEDDGKGFDVKHAAMKEGSERGLGLATMDERARMLGGCLDLWSEEGKGTRLTLSIPIKKGESL